MTLNFAKALQEILQEMIEKLTEKIDKLSQSGIKGVQALGVVKQNIIPSITYAFPVMPLKTHDLDRLDSQIAKATKHALQLPPYAANRVIHADIHQGGMGMPSLKTQFYQLQISNLITTLNDQGPLGLTTRALLQDQVNVLQGIDPRHALAHSAHLRLAKQVAMIHGQASCHA
jgi:hypothetical protein